MQAQTAADTRGISREEWLNERRRGIGGSDAAAIMGDNPYRGPLAVYADKLGLSDEKPTSEAMRQGTDLEEYVAQRFAEQTGKRVRRCNRILQHPAHPFMLANVDRMIVGENAGLECKTTSVYNKSDFESGEVPKTYQWQCQHYMAVTGADKWYLAILVLSKAFYVFEVERDEDAISALIESETEFWRENVLAHVPPYALDNDADAGALETVYHDVTDGKSVDLSGVSQQLSMLDMYKAEIKRLTALQTETEGFIKAALNDAETGSDGLWRVSWKREQRRTIDSKAIKADGYALPDKYYKVSESRVLRISKIKEEKKK